LNGDIRDRYAHGLAASQRQRDSDRSWLIDRLPPQAQIEASLRAFN
jgi:hypothetical protein